MNGNRGLSLAWIAAIAASVGDFLLLFVGNAVNAGSRVRFSELLLAVGGLLGCVAMPCYAFGYAALARVVPPKATTTAAVILYGGIAFGILCAIIHGATTLRIRSLMRRVAPRSSSLSPMEGVVSQGGLLLTLWIIGGNRGACAGHSDYPVELGAPACYTGVAWTAQPTHAGDSHRQGKHVFNDWPLLY